MEQKDCATYKDAEWLTGHLDPGGKHAFLKGYFKYTLNYRSYVKQERCKRCTIDCQVKHIIKENDAEWSAWVAEQAAERAAGRSS